jgi:RHS repeat-associated protein
MFSATYYVDEEGVFEQKRGDANPKFAYADIASLNETEGRTEYTGGIPTANYFYIKDHLGSTRMTVDENGNQSENVSYLAYGTEIDLGVSSSFTREKFTGKEFDSEGGMGLYYFGRRYLDPEIGLWVSADPKQEFWNAYQYTVNPISHIDIFGLSDVHFMLGGTLYRDKQTGKLNHFISMAKFKAELQSNIKAFKDKGYTVQFDYLNKKTVETALKDNSKFMYSVSHGNKEGEMSGRDIKGNESDVKPGNIEVKEQNVETKWNAYGCELAGGVDEWEPKVYQFRSWNNTETDTKKAMDLMKFEAERDADLADKKEKKSQPDESDKKKNNQTTQKQVKNE